MEEVQKLSKPGTVAAMKAYFETRYKRFVYNKKSAVVLPNHQDEEPRDSHNPDVKKIHNNSQMVSDSEKLSKDVSCYVTKEIGCLVARGSFLTMLSTSMLLQKQMIRQMSSRKEK